MESRNFIDGTEFPQRSKIPALLDRIRFTYVPAIKDKAFFADLQGRLYDVLSSVAEGPLKDSAGAFQAQLGAQLHELLNTLHTAFGAEATMRLPENLRQIFENLEINSGEIPLSRRGDGIKIRHIPMMLNFISVKRDELLTRGGVRYTHIWGFEEPENNVEMSSAFQMAGEFVDLITTSRHFQLFLTTHSPIFYRLDSHRPEAANWLVSHFVSKSGKDTSVETRSPDEVDESMGLMPIVAPYITQAKARFDELNAQLLDVREVAEQRRPTIFVEGDNDLQVINRSWILFSGQPDQTINISAGGNSYGGANALQSRALAWLLTLRHKPVVERVKAVAIFDADLSGSTARKNLIAEIERLNLSNLGLKILGLRAPNRLVPLIQKGFQIPIDLESYYTDSMWERANSGGWLESIDELNNLLSPNMVKTMLDSGANPFQSLSPADALRLKFKFSDNGKRNAARKIMRATSAEATQELDEFKPLIAQIMRHFGMTESDQKAA